MSAVIETPSMAGRKLYFSPVRWTAILAGLVGAMGAYLLLALFGLATGLTVVEPQAGQEQVGAVSVGMGIYTGIITLVAAFIGGYIAARLSGLSRFTDGLLHGFVTWAATTLLFAYLATTALSYLFGSSFSLISRGMQAMQQGNTVENLTAASWWLFIGLALSLIVALLGGASGTRSLANRTRGEHADERRPVTR